MALAKREAQSPKHIVQNCALGSRQGCRAESYSGCKLASSLTMLGDADADAPASTPSPGGCPILTRTTCWILGPFWVPPPSTPFMASAKLGHHPPP